MIDKKKDLIVSKNTVLQKFVEFFKRLFNFKKKKEKRNNYIKSDLIFTEQDGQYSNKVKETNAFLKNNDIEIFNLQNNKSKFEKCNFIEDLDYEKEKIRIFNLYSDIKAGKEKLENLSGIDLIKINQLIKEELKLKNV